MSQSLSYQSPMDHVMEFTQSAPVDLNGMARAMGLEVVNSVNLPDDVLGKIERSGDHYRITINATHAPRRRRFTLAHEIAHFVMHRSLIGDGITDAGMYRSSLSNAIESQANRFAADLLMPAPLVRRAFREGALSYAGMADRFNVSMESAKIRMKDLGLGA